MKNKDSKWYDRKIEDIKKRKRQLKNIQEPSLVKKMKKDLKREQRAAKRAEKQYVDKYIDNEINEG